MDTCPDCGSGSPIYTPGRWTDRQVRDVKTGEQRTVRTYEKPRCIVCAMRRVHEQHCQMKERSGPQYELSASRSRVGSAAYRAAGSPPKVRSVTHGSIDADGQWHGELKYYLARSMRRAGC
jgi:hypothetical protein